VLFRSHGRPDFLTDELLASFIREAEENKAETFMSGAQRVGAGGKIANAFAVSDELMAFMESVVPGGVHPTGIASYIHYDKEGAGIEPHVDTDIFFINLLIMLSHVREGDGDPSTLVIYPAGQPMQRFLLEPGETVVMDAAGLIHGREPVKAGETVTILTIGFQPRRAAADRL